VTKNFVNWGKISLHLPGRTAMHCRDRWIFLLDATIDPRHYSADGVEVYADDDDTSDDYVSGHFPQ